VTVTTSLVDVDRIGYPANCSHRGNPDFTGTINWRYEGGVEYAEVRTMHGEFSFKSHVDDQREC